MTPQEFTDKLNEEYKKPADIVLINLHKWLSFYSPEEVNDIYYVVTLNHKWARYPKVADIQELWNQHKFSVPKGSSGQSVFEKTAGWDIINIIEEITRIRKNLANDNKICIAEGDFIHAWDELSYAWYVLVERKGWDINRASKYLEPIKQKIIEGISIDFSRVETIDIDIAQGEGRIEEMKPISELF